MKAHSVAQQWMFVLHCLKLHLSISLGFILLIHSSHPRAVPVQWLHIQSHTTEWQEGAIDMDLLYLQALW